MKSFEIKGTRPIDGQPRSIIAIIEGEDRDSAVERAYKVCPGLCIHTVTQLKHWLCGGESVMVG